MGGLGLGWARDGLGYGHMIVTRGWGVCVC